MGNRKRGGIITQEELKKRIEIQQKENEQRQMQFHQFNPQRQQDFNPQRQQYVTGQPRFINATQIAPPTQINQPIKAESPLQSIGRPANNHQR